MGADYTEFSPGKFALDVNIVGGLSQLSAGVSTGGNTAGTTGTVDQQLVFVGGSNVTLSESINAQSATITINAATQAATVVNVSLSGTNTSGTSALVSSGTLFLAGGSNITLSQAGTQSVTISNYPGLLKPELQNTIDIGASYNWIKTAVTGATIRAVCYLGSGIVILGTTGGHIWRSIDYGFNWSDLGQIVGANQVWSASYQGKGIVVLSDSNGHIWGSTDYGRTWIDEGQIVGANTVRAMTYCGANIVVAVVDNGHVFRSTNNGSTWVDLGDITGAGSALISVCYTDSQVTLIGCITGQIFRSTNQGATWGAAVQNVGSSVNSISYAGNNRVLLGTDGNIVTAGAIWMSKDNGSTWTQTSGSASGTSAIHDVVYLGNGNAIFGDGNAHIFKSIDFGNTWTDEGVIGTTAFDFNAITYISNGLIIAGDSTGNVVRGDVSYKLDECMVANSVGLSTLGNTSGTTGLRWQQVVFAGGNNVTLSESTSNGSATITISAFNQSVPTNVVSSLNGSPGQLTLVAGNLMSISNNASTISIINLLSSATTVSSVTSANVVGAMASRFALEGHQHAGVNAAGVTNLGNTSGNTAVLPGVLVLAGGNNITLSESTDASNNMTVTISAGTGTGAASTFQAGVSTGGNTSGTTGTVSAQLILVGGNSITLSESTNGGSATVTISGRNAIRFVTESVLTASATSMSIGNFVSSNRVGTLHVFISNSANVNVTAQLFPLKGAGLTVDTSIQTRVGISQADGGGPAGIGDQSPMEIAARSSQVGWGIINVLQSDTVILLQGDVFGLAGGAGLYFPQVVNHTGTNETAITGFFLSCSAGTLAPNTRMLLYAGEN